MEEAHWYSSWGILFFQTEEAFQPVFCGEKQLVGN